MHQLRGFPLSGAGTEVQKALAAERSLAGLMAQSDSRDHASATDLPFSTSSTTRIN